MHLGKYGGVTTQQSMFDFYQGKNVFITGHTGFKGSWLCKVLLNFGANITGYSIGVPTMPSLFKLANIESKINHIVGDVRDLKHLQSAFLKACPEIVFHLAAQPLVRESYQNPVETYETNVLGTVNILECIRNSQTVRSFLNVTTDKVYKNNEWEWGYRENDPLDGYDPYSNSKSCSELVTHSYRQSFFSDCDIAISTARAGNVIGGGDFSKNRIIPDCVRAVKNNVDLIIRNPNSIRPYQYVLEPIFAYLLIAKKQYENIELADYYNVGPNDNDCISTGDLVDLFYKKLNNGLTWKTQQELNAPHEANFLKLDCSKIKTKLDWHPRWDIVTAVEKTVKFLQIYLAKRDLEEVMNQQIGEFLLSKEKEFIESV